MLTLSDKPIHAYSLGRERNLDAIEMVKIARGIDDETLEREPSLFTVINSSSPLRLDTPMLEGVIQMARRNQVVVLTPFTLAGAMAPVTLAGALAEQHAEALAGLVMTQVARPGAPFVYGGFTSNVDMKSGAPAFGTPEYMKTAIVGGQLARRLGLPYRSSNANAANSLDAQAAYESVFSLWGAIMGGVNFLMHGAGWMEGGLQASFEKMALDADLLAMVAEFLRPLRVDEAELALEAMREVGPGGHFFGAEHTQSRYRTAFFPPMISDWRNYESWREAGSPTALTPPSASSPSGCAISSPRRSRPSASRRSPPSSPAARRKAARRPTFERDPAARRLPRRRAAARGGRGDVFRPRRRRRPVGRRVRRDSDPRGRRRGDVRNPAHRLYRRLSHRHVGRRGARASLRRRAGLAGRARSSSARLCADCSTPRARLGSPSP